MSDSTDEVRSSLSNGKNIPVPDPSLLSTEALEREILHLRQLLEARLDSMDSRWEQTRSEQAVALVEAKATSERAISAALATSDKAITELGITFNSRIDGLSHLVDSKFDGVSKEFVTFRTLLDSNANQASLALNSADKAVAAAFASSKEAINKAETSVEKRFDLITKQIDELKTYRDTTGGKSSGMQASWGILLGAIAGLGGLLTLIIIIANYQTSK